MTVVFSIGSNLGNRLGHLQTAADLIAAQGDVRVSPVYETAPVGGPTQGEYLNAVLLADLPAGTDLLDLVVATEDAAGRERTERWGPRTLDVDVITVRDRAVGDPDVDHVVSADPALTLPHPRAQDRAFVLAPWLDIEPTAVLPGVGTVADLLKRVGRDGVARRDDLALTVR